MARRRFRIISARKASRKERQSLRRIVVLIFPIFGVNDSELRRARRVGRPKTGNAKQLIAIRIAPRLLTQLRRLAAKQSKPYKRLIHEMLERAATKQVA